MQQRIFLFSITLRENDANSYTYKVSRKIFDILKKHLEPFRSYQSMAKKIRCIETGKIFNSAREASHWVEFARETAYYDMNLIKLACKGKQKTSHGYHWEFAEEESGQECSLAKEYSTICVYNHISETNILHSAQGCFCI